jgi:hypothetical protein
MADARTPAPVRLGALGELAAALPTLIGFRPRESLLAVSLHGRDTHRLGLTARVDLPPPGSTDLVLATVVRSMLTDRPDAVVLAVVSDAADQLSRPLRTRLPDGAPVAELPHRALLGDAVRRFTDAGVPVQDTMLVRRGRWWSYECTEECCAPGTGTPVPQGPSTLDLVSALSGQVVEDDRSALARRIAPVGFLAAAGMAQASAEVGHDVEARTAWAGRSAVARESWAAVRAAVARVGPGSVRTLPDRDVARLAWGLRDLWVRDRAMGLALGESVAGAEVLWTELTRRAPPPLDAAPATLLAVTAWVRGDGAMANVALERALDSEPGYSLAHLLRTALDACFPPADLRRLIRDSFADAGGPDDEDGADLSGDW